MKNQVLFSSKDKSKKIKCRLLQFLFGALKVSTKISFVNVNCRINSIVYHLQSSKFCTNAPGQTKIFRSSKIRGGIKKF